MKRSMEWNHSSEQSVHDGVDSLLQCNDKEVELFRGDGSGHYRGRAWDSTQDELGELMEVIAARSEY
jgi:hypothetical protein